jgi:hypothetical protein
MSDTATDLATVVREIVPPEDAAALRRLREVACLYADGHSVSRIARSLKITARCVREYLAHPSFDAMIQEHGAAVQAATERRQAYLGRVVDEAVGVFEDGLSDENPQVRLKAAGEILDREGSMVKQRRQMKVSAHVTMTGADLAKLKNAADNPYMKSATVEEVTGEVVEVDAEVSE